MEQRTAKRSAGASPFHAILMKVPFGGEYVTAHGQYEYRVECHPARLRVHQCSRRSSLTLCWVKLSMEAKSRWLR